MTKNCGNCFAVCSWICISLLFFRLIDPNGLVPLVSESIELRATRHSKAPARSPPPKAAGSERKGSFHHIFFWLERLLHPWDKPMGVPDLCNSY